MVQSVHPYILNRGHGSNAVFSLEYGDFNWSNRDVTDDTDSLHGKVKKTEAVICGDDEGAISFYLIEDGISGRLARRHENCHGKDGIVIAIRFKSPDIIVSQGRLEGLIKIWKVSKDFSGLQLKLKIPIDPLSFCAFSMINMIDEHEMILAAPSAEKGINLMKVENFKKTESIEQISSESSASSASASCKSDKNPMCLSFYPKTSKESREIFLVIGFEDGSVELLAFLDQKLFSQGKMVKRWDKLYKDPILSVAWNEDGSCIWVSSACAQIFQLSPFCNDKEEEEENDSTVKRTIDADFSRKNNAQNYHECRGISSILISKENSKLLFALTWSGEIRVFQIRSNVLAKGLYDLGSLSWHHQILHCGIVFNPSTSTSTSTSNSSKKTILAVGGKDGNVSLWPIK